MPRLDPRLLIQGRALVALVLLFTVFSLASPAFLTSGNLMILCKHVAVNALLAIGMTYVVLAGGIDLSVGSIAGLSGMVAGALIHQGVRLGPIAIGPHPPLVVVLAVGLGVGALAGAVNGLLVARLRVAPFIVTLGTLYACRGLALLLSNGATFPDLAGQDGSGAFAFVGGGTPLGIPTPIYLMLAAALVASFVSTRTVFGRHVYAVGGNERAALLAGVPVARVKTIVYVVSGVCAALGGLVVASQLGAAHPATGQSFELGAIAAVVLGGTSLAGGVGTIRGTLLGAFVIGVLDDGLVLLGVSEFWQMVVKGAVIVLAVLVERLPARGRASRGREVVTEAAA